MYKILNKNKSEDSCLPKPICCAEINGNFFPVWCGNAAIHFYKQCKRCVQIKNLFALPLYSPDCNPIENLWEILSTKFVRKKGNFLQLMCLKNIQLLEQNRSRKSQKFS